MLGQDTRGSGDQIDSAVVAAAHASVSAAHEQQAEALPVAVTLRLRHRFLRQGDCLGVPALLGQSRCLAVRDPDANAIVPAQLRTARCLAPPSFRLLEIAGRLPVPVAQQLCGLGSTLVCINYL